jgi:hypothetical protein
MARNERKTVGLLECLWPALSTNNVKSKNILKCRSGNQNTYIEEGHTMKWPKVSVWWSAKCKNECIWPKTSVYSCSNIYKLYYCWISPSAFLKCSLT